MAFLETVAPSIIGGLFGAFGQKKANKMNIALARENRAWQERMSNTAYQRAATDLQKAGLNRILALGSPAGTPGGNVATVGNVGAAGIAGAAEAGSTAMAQKRLKQEIANMQAVEEKDIATKALTSQNYNVQEQQEEVARNTATLLKHQIPGAKAEARFWQNLDNMGSSAKGILALLPLIRALKGK